MLRPPITGLDELDKCLDPLPFGLLVVVAGPISMGKTTLALNVAKNVGTVVWVAFDEPPEDVYDRLVSKGIKNPVIFDGFTPMEMLRRGRWIRVESYDVYGIINEVARAATPHSVIVIDSINEIVMKASTSVVEFFKAIKLVAKRSDSLALLIVHTDVEEVASSVMTAMHITDLVIEMDIDSDAEKNGTPMRRARISHYKRRKSPTPWIYYEIVGDGEFRTFASRFNACQT